MSKEIVEIGIAFRAAGLRATSQRYAVLAYLANAPVHATAEEIFGAVNRRDPRVSRATVYNTLKSLIKTGLVREVLPDGPAARFDANLHRHHHFICQQCGTMEDIPWFDIPSGAGAAELGGRSVAEYEVVFRGVCMKCGRGGKR